MFSPEFTGGMTTEYRSRLLGDVDDVAPAQWAWGGPSSPRIDVVLMLYAADDGREDMKEPSEMRRVLRGGSCFDDYDDLRCAARFWNLPDYRYDLIGFRVVSRPHSRSDL